MVQTDRSGGLAALEEVATCQFGGGYGVCIQVALTLKIGDLFPRRRTSMHDLAVAANLAADTFDRIGELSRSGVFSSYHRFKVV